MNSTEAWDKLLKTYFAAEDQAAVEWSIGAIIAGGPKKILVITGPAASGKSTVVRLAEGIIEHCKKERSLRVAIRHDGLYGIETNAFMLAADLVSAKDRGNRVTDRLIEISTTGKQHPKNTYHMLTGLIDSERGPIGTHCLGTYRDLGAGYYNNQENHK